jgi:hypothetical protein
MKCACVLTLAIVLACLTGGGQANPQAGNRIEENMISTNECYPKGGVGIINPHLYVALKSSHNELILDQGEWVGKDRGTPEVVIIFENSVSTMANVPRGFSLDKAIIVSFESSVVRFFDAQKWSGGYYRRLGK